MAREDLETVIAAVSEWRQLRKPSLAQRNAMTLLSALKEAEGWALQHEHQRQRAEAERDGARSTLDRVRAVCAGDFELRDGRKWVLVDDVLDELDGAS